MTAYEWVEHVCSHMRLSMWGHEMDRAYTDLFHLKPQPVTTSAYDGVTVSATIFEFAVVLMAS